MEFNMRWVMVFTISSMLFIGCNRYWFNTPGPIQFIETFNKLTKSELYSKTNTESAIQSNKCKIIEFREYYSGAKLNGYGDMKSAAIGVDDWVNLDGGNSFSLVSYRWIQAGVSLYEGTGGTATELKIEFYTMSCDLSN
jgi:hypothetical protein